LTPTAPHQALYRRWRAQTFSQIVGQEAVVETLRNAVRMDRVSHAILFVGPRGTGKTSLARILAKAVNCTDLRDGDPCDACDACVAIREGTTLDVLEIDAASNRGINEVRDLRDRLAYPPGHLRRKVYILDEAHQITKDAWNALLKSLEEPPPFVIFMFASTEPSGFPPAILSRLQRYDVRRLTIPEIEGKLRRILEADDRFVEPTAIELIARLAAGGMRDAESILDQLLSTSDQQVSEQDVRELLGLADAAAVDGFLDALLGGDAAAGIAILDRLEERGRDPRALLDQVVEVVRGRLATAAASGDGASGAALAAAARRLVAIDPDRAGVGGLRLQLELALFDGSSDAVDASVARATPEADRSAPSVVEAAAPSVPSLDTATLTPAAAPTPQRVIADAPEPAVAATPQSSTSAPTAAPDPGVTSDVPMPAPGAPPDEPGPPDTQGARHAAPADGEMTLERVAAAWPDIVAWLSQKPAIKQLILTCRPVALDGSIVSLGFPEEQAFLRDVAERKRADIEAGIAEVVGRDIGIRCVVANIEIAPAPAVADDDFLMSEARRIFADDLVDVGEVS
jgi:DNA polymerase III subunit gamma/tau